MGPLRALTAERPPGVTPRGRGEVGAMGGSACSAPLGTGVQNPFVVPGVRSSPEVGACSGTSSGAVGEPGPRRCWHPRVTEPRSCTEAARLGPLSEMD